MKRDFIMMVGLPASGKSTIANQLKQEYEAKGESCAIISSDEIRKELFGDENVQADKDKIFNIMRERTIQAAKHGFHIIYDATNTVSKRRCSKLGRILPYLGENYQTKAVVIACEPHLCKRRDSERERHAGEESINKFFRAFEIPFHEEGFQEIQIIPTSDVTPMNGAVLKKMMDNFDQENPHHNETIGHHCDTVLEQFVSLGYEEDWQKLAAAYHDVGKLWTKSKKVSIEDGTEIAHYYNHENIGAYMLLVYGADIKKQANLTDKEWLDVLFLINYHMKPHNWQSTKSKEKALQRFGKEKMELLQDFNTCDTFRKLSNTLSK